MDVLYLCVLCQHVRKLLRMKYKILLPHKGLIYLFIPGIALRWDWVATLVGFSFLLVLEALNGERTPFWMSFIFQHQVTEILLCSLMLTQDFWAIGSSSLLSCSNSIAHMILSTSKLINLKISNSKGMLSVWGLYVFHIPPYSKIVKNSASFYFPLFLGFNVPLILSHVEGTYPFLRFCFSLLALQFSKGFRIYITL